MIFILMNYLRGTTYVAPQVLVNVDHTMEIMTVRMSFSAISPPLKKSLCLGGDFWTCCGHSEGNSLGQILHQLV